MQKWPVFAHSQSSAHSAEPKWESKYSQRMHVNTEGSQSTYRRVSVNIEGSQTSQGRCKCVKVFRGDVLTLRESQYSQRICVNMKRVTVLTEDVYEHLGSHSTDRRCV